MKNKLFLFLIMCALVLGVAGCNNKDLGLDQKEINESKKN